MRSKRSGMRWAMAATACRSRPGPASGWPSAWRARTAAGNCSICRSIARLSLSRTGWAWFRRRPWRLFAASASACSTSGTGCVTRSSRPSSVATLACAPHPAPHPHAAFPGADPDCDCSRPTFRGFAMPLLARCTCRAALLGIGALLSLAQPALAADQPKRGGTLVIGRTQTPRHLNGAGQSGVATGLSSTQIFASPLRFDGQWNPQPYLAQSWQLADDGKSLTLGLRKDALFHDGKPVTSADVAFSIMAIKANHPFSTMFGPVEKVDTPDPHTAIIRMSVPHPAIVLAMSPALCPILPRHIYGDGQDLKNHPRNSTDPVGSGPFRVP